MINDYQKLDFIEFANSFSLQDSLKGSRFLVTGSTGLIGSSLVNCLLALNLDCKIICPVRNIEKARLMYESQYNKIIFLECDLLNFLKGSLSNFDFDYIIHCASPTSGKYMIDHPVETYTLAIDTTLAILDYASKAYVKSIVYISSLEYYGQIFDDLIVTENMQGYVDSTDPRSSYPLGKRAAEYLCTSYAKEYEINVKIARLTQTFGPGVSKDDNRVFAQFARSVINGTDIILHTSGESAKPYCYTTDCVSAILHILLKGKAGEAYNVANEDTYISIKDMAYFLRDNFNPSINVIVEEHPEMGYAPVTKLRLSSNKLVNLGWASQYSLYEMFDRLINSIK